MILSEKYKEIMDQVRVTDEMKQRVLQNVKEGIEVRIRKDHSKPVFLLWQNFTVSVCGGLHYDADRGRSDCAAAAASGKWTSAGTHGRGSWNGTG